ncbi:MAG: CDP-diacylglycerol--serine O-phosphatidyltransferase [Candidatus Hydrogenedentes bacterium]|nr:CDP-diacylglycerol--serine O-phosphatidyltransferase [Candidatus Hydrogenedentota bacterium]
MLHEKKPRKRPNIARGIRLATAQRRRKMNRRRPINVLASGITTLNLYFGIAAIFAAIEGMGLKDSAEQALQFQKAAYFILAAMVVDTMDGAIARMTKSVSEFGKQLDSLCDVVSFGVAPAVLIYTMFLPGETGYFLRTGAFIAIIYAICTALRLARFNVFQSEMREYFIGLPSPAAAATVATFALFTIATNFTPSFWVFGPPMLALAILMVSTVQYPKNKMKSLLLSPRLGFRFLVVCAVAIAVFDMARRKDPALVLFPVTAAYALFGIGDTAYRRFFRRSASSSPGGAGSSTASPAKTGDAL